MEKKNFGLLLLFITMFLGTIFAFITISDFKEEKLNEKYIHKVTGVSSFYNVESCAAKYISYLVSKDYKAVYNLLDDNYIDKNNITESNLIDYIEFYDKNYNLKIESMYQYKDFNIYYIKGKLIEEGMNASNTSSKDFKITLKLDETNYKFSIIPDGEDGVIYD